MEVVMNNSSSTGSGSGSKSSQVSSTGTSSGTTSGMSSGSTSSGSGLSSGVFSSGTGSSSGLSPGMASGMSPGKGASAALTGAGLPSFESFMTPAVKNLAVGILVPAVLARIKLRWLAFGVVAYYGLRMLSQQGVLPKQANQALDSIDRGIDAAKEKIGFNKSTTNTSSIH